MSMSVHPTMQPPRAWEALSTLLALPPGLCQKVWKAFTTSADPRAQAFVFGLRQLDRAPGDALAPKLRAVMVEGPGRPHVVCAVLEILQQTGHVTRAEASAFEEAVLDSVDKVGHWR